MGIIGVTIWVTGVIYLLTKSPYVPLTLQVVDLNLKPTQPYATLEALYTLSKTRPRTLNPKP